MSPKPYIVDDCGFKFFKIVKTVVDEYGFNHLKKIKPVLTNSGFNFKPKTIDTNYSFNCFKRF